MTAAPPTVLASAPWASAVPQALAGFGLPPDAPARLLSLSENATYAVTDDRDGARYVLRLHRPGFRRLDHIRSELAWVTALRVDGCVETARVVPDAVGASVHTMAGPRGTEQHAVLFEFLDGIEPAGTDLVDTFVAVGAVTARLHDHARRWQPSPEFTRPVWNHRTLIGADAQYGPWRDEPQVGPAEAAVLGAAERRLLEDLSAYGCGPERFGLIHADLRTANLLVHADGIRVIDFDDCGFGWYMHDLACAVTFIEADPRLPALVRAWVRGYTSHEPLTDANLAVVPALVIMRRLQLVAWMHCRAETAQAAAMQESYVPESVRVAEEYLAGRFLAGLGTDPGDAP